MALGGLKSSTCRVVRERETAGCGGQKRDTVQKLKEERFRLDDIFLHKDRQALNKDFHRG